MALTQITCGMRKIIYAILLLLIILPCLAQRNYQLEYNPGLSKLLIQFPRGTVIPFNHDYSHQLRVQKEVFTLGSFGFSAGVVFSNFNAELNNRIFLENLLIHQYGEIPEDITVGNFRYSGFMAGPMAQVSYIAFQKGRFTIKPALGIDGAYVINETMTNPIYDHILSYYGENLLDKKSNPVKVIDNVYFGANLRLYFITSLQNYTFLFGPGIDYQLNNLVKPEYNKHVFINYGLTLGVKY